MFSNPKLSPYLPFPLCISLPLPAYLFPFPLISAYLSFTLCKPKVIGFMGYMHDVGKCQVVDFFSFHSPFFFFLVVFLIFWWLRVWTYLFIQVSANQHYFFSLLCVSFGFGGSYFNRGRFGHRASKCPNKKDFSLPSSMQGFFWDVNKFE